MQEEYIQTLETTGEAPDTFAQITDPLPHDPEPEQAAEETFSLSGEMINYIVIAIVFLLVGVVLGIQLGGESSVDSAELRALVQSAVADAVGQEQQVDYLTDDDPYIGPEDAPVVIVEFSDYLCPFCERHFQQTLTPLLENYEGRIRYVYRDFPGVGGQRAVEAAMAAQCAYDQGKFWEYHDLLFGDQTTLGSTGDPRDLFVSYASELDLNLDTFGECYDSEKYSGEIFRDRQEGIQNGVTGTPGFFINGQFLSGAQPYEVFAAYIDAELEDFESEQG